MAFYFFDIQSIYRLDERFIGHVEARDKAAIRQNFLQNIGLKNNRRRSHSIGTHKKRKQTDQNSFLHYFPQATNVNALRRVMPVKKNAHPSGRAFFNNT